MKLTFIPTNGPDFILPDCFVSCRQLFPLFSLSRVIKLSIVVASLLSILACGGGSSGFSDAPVTGEGGPIDNGNLQPDSPADAETLALGKGHYEKFCARCHGDDPDPSTGGIVPRMNLNRFANESDLVTYIESRMPPDEGTSCAGECARTVAALLIDELVAGRGTDRDGDGVLDSDDECPDEAGPESAAGCPEPTDVSTEEAYVMQCAGCHGNELGEDVTFGGALIAAECENCSSLQSLSTFIEQRMPYEMAEACDGACATEFATYILENFAGFNGIPGGELPVTVPIAGDKAACEKGIDVAFGGLRRVTRVEYNRLVNQLFKDDRDFSDNFGEDGKLGNFNVNVELPVSELQVEQYIEVGMDVAERAAQNLAAWMPCNDTTDACARTMIETTAKKAYRRPLSQQEIDRLFAVYTAAQEGATFADGIRVVLEVVLSSPNFLYHLEYGLAEAAAPGVVPLSQYELASRLAFFLWRSGPDDALLTAAEAGALSTIEQIRAQANRLIDDDRAKETLALFHAEWMRLQKPGNGNNSDASLVAATEDTLRTVVSLVYDDNASLDALFTVSYGFLNDLTKELYGVSGEPIGQQTDGYGQYILNGAQRGGLLSRAAFLRSNSPPTGRGKFIREQVLCGVIPPPPAGVPEVPEGDPNEPPRTRWLEHVSNPTCGGCHRLMDPLGFAFDHYDDDGRWRDTVGEQMWPVIDDGEIVETTDIDGFFDGGQELQGLLSTSVDTEACYTFQWVRFATGRQPGLEDSCSLAIANEYSAEANHSIRDIMLSVTLTDAFRYRRPEPKGDAL